VTEPDFVQHTRRSYDAFADDYTEWIHDELAAKPLDRAVLYGFAELVRGLGLVADLGCGPGRITAHLDSLDVAAFGIDLSPRMVTIARETYPRLRFEEGSILGLDLSDETLGGIVSWYSLIHIPATHRPDVLAEFHRVLAPGGYLQLAFQAGEDIVHHDEVNGYEISLDFHRLLPEDVEDMVRKAGFDLCARTVRERDTEDRPFPEKTPQAFVLARKPVARLD
jgi:SAM-dependent methyltransferase